MRRGGLQALTGVSAVILLAWGLAAEKKSPSEEGEFKISVAGREIGSERYILAISGDSAESTSLLSFRNPQDARQSIRLETKLSMNGRFTPRSYELKSNVDGRNGIILGKFSPNQVIFEYGGAGTGARRGLLVGDQYTILDTNVFHHFIFLARLFLEEGKGKAGRFEVVIPQENESGFLQVRELEKETITLRGKRFRCRHLQVDSGALKIDLWVDDQQLLRRIAVPARQIEVVRAG